MDNHEILPKPEVEHSAETVDAGESAHETSGAKRTETTPGHGAGSGAVSAAAVTDAQAHVQGVLPHDDSGQVIIGQQIPDDADDLDLIEKIWVQKAKDIVRLTDGDPYLQSSELHKMKVEYVKKRFNKELKLKEVKG